MKLACGKLIFLTRANDLTMSFIYKIKFLFHKIFNFIVPFFVFLYYTTVIDDNLSYSAITSSRRDHFR